MRSPFQKELSMNRLSAKPLLAAAIAFGALAAASAAHARPDVFVSIGIQAPYGYVQPVPVYVQPRPVYVQPQPVYVQPQPVYYRHHHQRRNARTPWGDADHDGVMNRHDRAPQNPYRY
jgi:hypothetical protein